MPLQPATIENGCMQFVPGSHHDGVHEHRLINPDSHGLVLSDLGAVVDPVPCPLPPGGATVHSSRTLHYAGPNTTDEPRRALIMAFAAGATAARGASELLLAATRVVRVATDTHRPIRTDDQTRTYT